MFDCFTGDIIAWFTSILAFSDSVHRLLVLSGDRYIFIILALPLLHMKEVGVDGEFLFLFCSY